jgi:hypothetical protein
MRNLLHLALAAVLVSCIGCSSAFRTEREDFTDPEARETYIDAHPDCRYGEQILNGEIIRGMDIYEVIASWGLPNVYLASGEGPKEHWIYYVQNSESKSVLIYTLTFTDDNLEGWNIDQKRLDDHRIVSDLAPSSVSPEALGSLKRKY